MPVAHAQASFAAHAPVNPEILVADRRGHLGISFTIAPNTSEIPPATLDEHVIVGGEYFTVLRGTYAIEEAEGGGFLLELSSRHRSATRFNFYTALRGHLIMADIQGRILEVIKRRCERKGSA